MAQFELYISQGVIPKSPRFYQRAEGSPVAHRVVAGDPSLRLKNGYAQDDDIETSPEFMLLRHRRLVPNSSITKFQSLNFSISRLPRDSLPAGCVRGENRYERVGGRRMCLFLEPPGMA